MEISPPFWEPESSEETEWSYDEEEEGQIELPTTEDNDTGLYQEPEDDIAESDDLPTLREKPEVISSGCSTSNGWLGAWFLSSILALLRIRRDT
jgi:hypothetical protein